MTTGLGRLFVTYALDEEQQCFEGVERVVYEQLDKLLTENRVSGGTYFTFHSDRGEVRVRLSEIVAVNFQNYRDETALPQRIPRIPKQR